MRQIPLISCQGSAVIEKVQKIKKCHAETENSPATALQMVLKKSALTVLLDARCFAGLVAPGKCKTRASPQMYKLLTCRLGFKPLAFVQ